MSIELRKLRDKKRSINKLHLSITCNGNLPSIFNPPASNIATCAHPNYALKDIIRSSTYLIASSLSEGEQPRKKTSFSTFEAFGNESGSPNSM